MVYRWNQDWRLLRTTLAHFNWLWRTEWLWKKVMLIFEGTSYFNCNLFLILFLFLRYKFVVNCTNSIEKRSNCILEIWSIDGLLRIWSFCFCECWFILRSYAISLCLSIVEWDFFNSFASYTSLFKILAKLSLYNILTYFTLVECWIQRVEIIASSRNLIQFINKNSQIT